MASCDLKTTNKEYMVSTGAMETGSLKIKNERLFDLKNAEIRDSANQRYNLRTSELPFTKTVRDIPRNDYLRTSSNYFVEWGFNNKFFDEVTPVVELYKSFENDLASQVVPARIYDQMQLSFEEILDDNIIVQGSPIRSTFPYEGGDYLEDVQPETKANLNKLQFKEQECGV
jgi:hypothetical protein